MKDQKIYWDKEYFEDLGQQKKDDFYDYAYCYHIYWFNLPNRQAIKARRYTDKPDECCLFGIYDYQNLITDARDGIPIIQLDDSMIHNNEYIGAVVNFLQTEGVKSMNYFDFNKGYCTIDNNRVTSSEIEFELKEIIRKTSQNMGG